MKKSITSLLIFCCIAPLWSQDGINTTDPQATLDINGTIRVRDFKNSIDNDAIAVKIIGIDEDGNFVQVDVDENVILEDNKLRVVENRYRIAETTTITVGTVHNLNLVILPGEPNDDKKVIKIRTNESSLEITGIKAGEDGQTLFLFAVDGTIKLLGNNNNSDPENQFLMSASLVVKQYEMVQLMYDATLQRWLVMDN